MAGFAWDGKVSQRDGKNGGESDKTNQKDKEREMVGQGGDGAQCEGGWEGDCLQSTAMNRKAFHCEGLLT